MVDDDPVVVGANRYRFAPGERIANPHVMSVSFIWVLSGSGEVIVDGRRFAVDGRQVVRLPWHHHVEYQAAQRSPFHVGTVHIVPRHTRDAPVVPRVAHRPGDPLLFDRSREGDPKAFLPGSSSTRNSAVRRIVEFGTIAIERISEGSFDEQYFRALGRLLLAENRDWGDDHAPKSALPGSLDLMMTFVRHHLGEPLTVVQVAQSGRCSETTAQRLFSRYVGASIHAWIRQVRLREAAVLLRTTGLRVSEVAQLVGYSDPLYFSRAFRSAYGVAPSRFARAAIRP